MALLLEEVGRQVGYGARAYADEKRFSRFPKWRIFSCSAHTPDFTLYSTLGSFYLFLFIPQPHPHLSGKRSFLWRRGRFSFIRISPPRYEEKSEMVLFFLFFAFRRNFEKSSFFLYFLFLSSFFSDAPSYFSSELEYLKIWLKKGKNWENVSILECCSYFKIGERIDLLFEKKVGT